MGLSAHLWSYQVLRADTPSTCQTISHEFVLTHWSLSALWTGSVSSHWTDFAFGGAFSCMAHGSDYDGVHHLLSQFVKMVEVCGTIPWTRPLIQALPSSKVQEILAMADQVTEKWKESGS